MLLVKVVVSILIKITAMINSIFFEDHSCDSKNNHWKLGIFFMRNQTYQGILSDWIIAIIDQIN